MTSERIDTRYSNPEETGPPKRYKLVEGQAAPLNRAPEAVSLKVQTALLVVKQSYEKRHPGSFPGDARQTIAFLIRLAFSHPDDYSEIAPLEALDNVRRASWGRPARRLPGDLRDPIAGYEPVVAALRAARAVLLAEMDFEMLPTEAVLRDAEQVMSEPIDAATVAAAKAAGIMLPTPGGVVPAKKGPR